ncbi:MAG: hypothetical protein ACI8V4_002572, partial [Ilumatobacter sp.]
CILADGMILGRGDWFKVDLSVEHLSSLHRGDDSCTIRVVEAG